MPLDLPPRYEPKTVEERIYAFWESGSFFHGEINRKKRPFSIAIPPPNVTGMLHMGHVLDNTPQDILVRYKRMKGYATTWIPGTDHAGIATQNVVERHIEKEGLTKSQLGREKFIERVWEWKEKYGTTIINQLKRLGCSCDWRRLKFTMDPDLSRAVTEAFCRLYEDGLIYQGDYIVNWCPRCCTALSDEETEHKEIEGGLYWIRYPFKNSDNYLTVATTRPETMLGDTAVAVHPNDPRYREVIGRTVILPIMNREIPVIADFAVTPDFGTGAVKVTPAHDPLDCAIAQRHNLPAIVVIAKDGTMSREAGKYSGIDRFTARQRILTELRENGLLEKHEKHIHPVKHCYRCDTIIEPYLSKQWFVKMKPLAEPAIEAVTSGKIKFYPSRWMKIYLNWMENIHDWCISRQLWWGHQIPVWYCKSCSEINVSRTPPEKCKRCTSHVLVQDEDVLDTWFSSWLWPFSTLGWPEKTPDMEFFYPTSVMNAGKDILFFWVARMIMAGLYFTKTIPFREVYLHGIARDEIGRKLSKSLGNSPDPIDLFEKFGADGVRFGIIASIAPGQDINLSDEIYTFGRNFANKIWNAARFIFMHLDETTPYPLPENLLPYLEFEDLWILSRLNTTIESYTKAIDSYEFNNAAHCTYQFFWHEFCDWYLEIVKPRLAIPKEPHLATTESLRSRDIARGVLATTLDLSLRLLHLIMPFITEELWQKLRHCLTTASPHDESSDAHTVPTQHRRAGHLPGELSAASITIAPWPRHDNKAIKPDIEEDMNLLQDIVRGIREIRNRMNILNTAPLDAFILTPDLASAQRIATRIPFLRTTANLQNIIAGTDVKKPRPCATAISGRIRIYVPLEGYINLHKEIERLQDKLRKLESQLDIVRRKLISHEFLTRAPAEVVQKERARSKELQEQISLIKEALEDL